MAYLKMYGGQISSPTPTIVTWADGTDAEIAAMLEAHYRGIIDVTAIWNVGDERVVSLSAMEATGVGESHVAQDVKMVLMNVGGKTLVTPINGKTECAFIVGQKDLLTGQNVAEAGYMNSTDTSIGGWDVCARRTWCNSVYKNALPSTLVGIFKEHQNITAYSGLSATPITSNDYFALPSEKELYGSTTYANATVESSNAQFEYYKTPSNRIKRRYGDYATWYWQRSPANYNSENKYFCCVNGSGDAVIGNAIGNNNISPFGVI